MQEKIKSGKKICIIGDYDIDGVQSSYILWEGIENLGGKVYVTIPDRIKDGYGVNEQLVEAAIEEGADTILTCDNGIAAADALKKQKENGLTVIVTDHHEIPFCEENGERKRDSAGCRCDRQSKTERLCLSVQKKSVERLLHGI